MIHRTLIAAVTSLAMLGCTTMRPLDAASTQLIAGLEPGDHLVIYERTGRIVDMTLTEIDGHRLHGTTEDPGASPVAVDVYDIEHIEVEKIDPAKTALAGIGVAVVILPLVLIGVLASGGMPGFPSYR